MEAFSPCQENIAHKQHRRYSGKKRPSKVKRGEAFSSRMTLLKAKGGGTFPSTRKRMHQFSKKSKKKKKKKRKKKKGEKNLLVLRERKNTPRMHWEKDSKGMGEFRMVGERRLTKGGGNPPGAS